MLPWVLFVSTAVVAAFLQWRQTSHSQTQVQNLKRQHRESLVVLDDGHKGHIQRLKREFEGSLEKASFSLMKSLLPGCDALWQATVLSQKEDVSVEAIASGLELVQSEILKALREHDIVLLDTVPGDTFDPHIHEAIGVVESSELPDGTIAQVIRVGWTHPAGVIRPTLVQTVRNISSRKLPVDSDKKEELSGDSDEKEELPVDSDEKEELPVDSDEKEELPVNSDEKEELPVDSDEKEELPVDSDEKEELPVNSDEKEELPGDSDEKEELPGDSDEKEELPGDRSIGNAIGIQNANEDSRA